MSPDLGNTSMLTLDIVDIACTAHMFENNKAKNNTLIATFIRE